MQVTIEMSPTTPIFVCEPEFQQRRQLYSDLTWSSESDPRIFESPRTSPPPDETDPEPGPCVPEQPLLSLSDEKEVFKFLNRDLCHDTLNELFPIFWLLATQRSDHISALHDQIVKGRDIVITEDPGMHLLWYYNRVFIKPLPPCLTSHAFWKEFLCRDSSVDLRRAALGYVRSYCHLIKCQSDIVVAKQKKLIAEDVDPKALLRFLHSFQSVSDNDVTPRYKYGELRLSRINLYIKFYKRHLHYKKVHWQYSDYLSTLITPFAFIFALVSAALSAMQVVLAAQQFKGTQTPSWRTFTSASQWSAVAFLILIAVCTFVFPFMVCLLLLRELLFALGSGNRHKSDTTPTESSADHE